MTNFDKFKTYCRKFCVQTRLAVRISLSITAITTFATQAAAQNNPQEIRLDFNDAALSQVLKSIETQSRYTFFYNNDIDVTQSVSAHIASSDINSVVTAVLKGTDIAHRITDNRVVLFVGGGDAADDQERSISGKVTDAAGRRDGSGHRHQFRRRDRRQRRLYGPSSGQRSRNRLLLYRLSEPAADRRLADGHQPCAAGKHRRDRRGRGNGARNH